MNRTKKLLTTYIASSMIYLVAQEALNVFAYYYHSEKIKLETFSPHTLYFVSPGVSTILVLISYVVLKRFYQPHKEHYLLHVISWIFLFIPQIIPPFFYGLNIIYITWTFVMSTTVVGTIIFQDMAIIDVDMVQEKKGKKFIYDEMKFYIDKLSIAWLTLGTVLAVCMTILWTAPITSFKMEYEERVFWAVYMVFCFLIVSILVGIFTVYPILINIRKARNDILKRNTNADNSD